MEVKAWTYEEFPDFTEEVEGAVRMKTTGDEMGVYIEHDVQYAEIDGTPLRLQIIYPFTRNEPEKVYPCLMLVQGSAWKQQKIYRSIGMYARLASKGFVVAVVEYRHSGIAAFPAPLQDSKNAIRFMRIHAAEYHADPDNIFVGGGSSGGHMAVFCGIVQDGDEMDASLFPGVSARVNGIIDHYGALNGIMEDGFPSELFHHLANSPEGMEMGHVNLREHPELREKMTAECYITPQLDLPPILIVHGTKDRTINTMQSVSLFRKLKECGKEASLYLLEGADHGGGEFWTDELCELAASFMRSHLK